MYSLDLHPDGEQFVTGAEDGSVDLWNSRTLSHIACLWRHEGAVRCVACCKTSCVIVSASYDGLVRWGSGREGQSDCLNGHQGRRVWSVTFLSGSDVFASGGEDNGVVLWSKGSEGRYRALKKLRAFDEHDGRVLSLGAGSSGSILVAGCADASGGGNNSLYLWKISEGYRKILLEKVKSPVLSIGVHPTEPLLITGNEESTLSVWDTEALTKQKRLDGYNHCLYTISASPRERVACIGGSDGVVRLIDTNEGKCRREYTGHTNRVWSSAFSSDGSRFATGSEDCTIRVWGLDRKESYAILRDHSGRVYSLRFSRDGRFLVSGSEDNLSLIHI